MRVRAIDKNGDWTFGHSRNNYKTGIEAVKQSVVTRIKSFKNDWFLDGEAYNVGTGHVYQIKGLIEMICEKMNWKKGIEIVEKSFPEITTQFLYSEKINSLGSVS